MVASTVEVMPRGRGQLSRTEWVLRMLDPRRGYAVRWEDGEGTAYGFLGTFRAVNRVLWLVHAAGAHEVEGFRPGWIEDTFLFPSVCEESREDVAA